MEHTSDEPMAGLQVVTAGDGADEIESQAIRLGLIGELDLATVGILDRRIDQLLQDGCKVEIDLSGLTFIDSTGLGLLIRRARGDGQADGAVTIRRSELANQVRRLIDMTGTNQTLWP